VPSCELWTPLFPSRVLFTRQFSRLARSDGLGLQSCNLTPPTPSRPDRVAQLELQISDAAWRSRVWQRCLLPSLPQNISFRAEKLSPSVPLPSKLNLENPAPTFESCYTMSNGFLRVEGEKVLDEKGNTVILRGAGLGGWMNMENFM
jgi:hypothetical protein